MGAKIPVKKPSLFSKVTDLVTGKSGIPYNYVIGGKDSAPSPIPFDVKLSLDPDFKKTLLKGTAFVGGGIFLGWVGSTIVKKYSK